MRQTRMKWLGILAVIALLAAAPGYAQDPNSDLYWATSQDIFLDPNLGGSVRQETTGFTVYEGGKLNQVTIIDSFQNCRGVFTVNQVAGNLNNMVTLVSVNQGPTTTGALQVPVEYTSIIRKNTIWDIGSIYRAVINGGSFRGSQGIAAVSQVVGNINHTFTSIAVSMNGAPGLVMALDNLSLNDIQAQNTNEIMASSTAEVRIDSGAFQDFKGVGTVTQVAGNMNQVVNHISLKVNP